MTQAVSVPGEPVTAATADLSVVRRVTVGGAVGSFVEWYEFAIYGFLAVILARVFFPDPTASVALLSTFVVFAVAFFARPLGGFVWGFVGDKIGRRRTLALTVITISAATALIGVLPGAAAIGIAAPILLVSLRILQGISAGGEISSAVSFVAEHAPIDRRGRYVAGVQAGSVLGNLGGALVAGILILALPDASMVEWGWRIPFLLAVPLGLVGFYIRRRLEETPNFLALQADHNAARNPIAETLRGKEHLLALLRAFFIVALNGASFFLIVGFLPTYTNTTLGLSGWAAFGPPVIALLAVLTAVVFGSRLSDRFGRKRLLLTASTGLLVLALPCFLLITSGAYAIMAIGLIVFGLLAGTYGVVAQVTLAEMFPTRVRVSGHGVAYNLSVAIFGGTAPYVLTALTSATGSSLVGAFYVMAIAVISTITILTINETSGSVLRQV